MIDSLVRATAVRSALLLLLVRGACAQAPAPPPHGPQDPDVERLARASVDARFLADPADPRRDLVTGRSRDALHDDARGYYADLRRREPARFERLAMRLSGGAEELLDAGRSELAAGRPVSAELAWRRVAVEHPRSEAAPQALLHLASVRLEAGDLVPAAADLARLPELDLRASVQAAPLIERLLAEVEEQLDAAGDPPGSQRVRLHESLERPGLDRARRTLEWTDGWMLSDEVARTLRLETSGDVLRRLKNVGADRIRLDALVGLIPMEERLEAARVEELLKSDAHDAAGADAIEQRVEARRRSLDRLEGLSRLQQLQVVLLARCLEQLELREAPRDLGQRTLEARHALAARLESLARAPVTGGAPTDEAAAVGRLFRLADFDGDGTLSTLWDDEGLLRPKRPALESDMRNARDKPLDDDNRPPVAELFQRLGMTESSLFHALVRAALDEDAGPAREAPRVSPRRTASLLERLRERGLPVLEARRDAPRHAGPLAAERDYLCRLAVLRLPGEGLDDVLRRDVLEAEHAGPAMLADQPEAAPVLAELASLGRRVDGAWLYEDDPPLPDGRPGMTAEAKFERSRQLRQRLDDVAAGAVLAASADSLFADLESQGLRVGPSQRDDLRQRIQHEDLGTLALVFDEWGAFDHVDHAFAFTEPGTKLGDTGPGHVAYGFGLDATDGTPGANVGWRGGRQTRRGSRLRYHVGATAASGGPADSAGVAARFRAREVWQPEVGVDASVLRGLAGRGFLNLIRDVNVKHQRRLAEVCARHEEALRQGREPFVASMLSDDAEAKPAAVFVQGLGHGESDLLEDEESFLLLADSYELERARLRSELDRRARKVRFAGLGLTAAFFAGDVHLLLGPKLAFKDYRLFSQFVDGAERRVQSEEALVRRVAVPLGRPAARGRRETLVVDLQPVPDGQGRPALAARGAELSVGAPALPGAFVPSLEPGPREQRAVARVASLAPVSLPEEREGGLDEAEALGRLNAALRAAGAPLRLEATDDASAYRVVPRLPPWGSQSVEIFADEQQGLGLAVAGDGHPLLLAPPGGATLVLDWMEEVRSITRPGVADEVHRVAVSLAPGRPAAEIIESSAWLLRTEIVDGALLGTARIATRFTDRAGTPLEQANVLDPTLPDAAARQTRLAAEAAAVDVLRLPELPAVTLRRPPPAGDDGTISDADALAPAFLDELAATSPADLAAFKDRNIRSAGLAASSGAGHGLDPENLALVQAASLRHHGRPLSGEALERAWFALTHEGLYRADGGSVARQVSFLEQRALTPFEPGREISGAPDARTRRLVELAGVDEAAALAEVRAHVGAMVRDARGTGRLPRQALPSGTRIVTASWGRTEKGVQHVTARQPVEAHLVAPFPLSGNTGRYLAALAVGRDLEALDAAIRAQLEDQGDAHRHPFDLDADLVPATAAALAAPAGPRRLEVRVAGLDVDLVLEDDGRAGALARCKNATLFPPAYGARLSHDHGVVVAAEPVAFVGSAEADTRFVGRSWVGWRRLSLLAGAPLLFGDDDKRSVPEEPEPPEPPGRGGVAPPGGRPPRPGLPDRPQPEVSTPPEPGGGREGSEPPPGGRPPGGDPPGRPRPEPPGPVPPRDGAEPPPGTPPDRPEPPPAPDRPRRPVD